MTPGTRSTTTTQGELQYTHPQVQVHSSKQHGGTTATGTAAGRNPHTYKISPPRFTREYNTFEEWKYKMTAHLGLQDPAYNRLLRQSEQVTSDQLENAAPSQQMAEQWIQPSNNLHYILVSTRDGPASTICRQNMQGNGFGTWRLTHARYSTPLGARSIGHLTRLTTNTTTG